MLQSINSFFLFVFHSLLRIQKPFNASEWLWHGQIGEENICHGQIKGQKTQVLL